MVTKYRALDNVTSKLLRQADKYQDLKKLANKKNYPHKVQQLLKRLSNEISFWEKKGSSPQLDNLNRDYKYVNSLQNLSDFTAADKERLDLLVAKYPI